MALEESLVNFGQVVELLVRPHPEFPGEYQIIDGEHRFNVLPDLVSCNVIYGLSEPDAKKLTIIMNTKGEADKIELATLLAEISEDYGSDLEGFMSGLPYEQDELSELIKLASYDWENFDTQEPEEGTSDAAPSSDGETWVTLTAKLPASAHDRVMDCYNLIKEERDGLHKDREIAMGQVIESMAAEYLAMPRAS